MSAQSGIGVGEALTAAWAETSAPESSVRLLKISIEQESLVPSASKAPSRTAEEDFELLEDLLDPVTPSYFAYRLDPNEAGSTSWLFITYVPDEAKVRDKMVYASTRATLTRQLGDSRFSDSMFATNKKELTSAGYRAHLASGSALAPMTTREKELADIKAAEGLGVSAAGTTGRSSSVWGHTTTPGDQLESGRGVGLRWTDEAKELKQKWAEGETRTAQFHIDIPTESIYPSTTSQDALTLPSSEPSYTFHTADVAAGPAHVYIYCCPSGCPVKSRMIYSANSIFTSKSVEALGISLSKRLETSDPQEVTEAWVKAELGLDATPAAPGGDDAKPKFAKPARPGKRRP